MPQFGIPELPGSISVETCIISRETARLHNLDVIEFSSISSNNQCNGIDSTLQGQLKSSNVIPIIQLNSSMQTTAIDSPNGIGSPLMLSPANPLFKTYNDVGLNTDAPNPMRDRTLQTDIIKTISIGIQCNVEEELFYEEPNGKLTDNEKYLSIEDEKNYFIDFIKRNTKRYGNGKIECKLCGEVKSRPKLATSHMTVHWGPPKLCARCGVQFENAVLWKKHNCGGKRTKRHYIKCPYYSCGVAAISPAELYEHLNEHCGLRPHCCTKCKKSFPTVGELSLHRKLHKKCLNTKLHDRYKLPSEDTLHRKRAVIFKTAQGKRILIKSFLSQINNIRSYCPVCLKYCKNGLQYKQHTKRCVYQHEFKLKRKRESMTHDFPKNNVNGMNID